LARAYDLHQAPARADPPWRDHLLGQNLAVGADAGRRALPPCAGRDRLVEIDLDDVTEDLAHRGGFADLDDLMSVARHGRGERVFLVEFRYLAPA